MEARCREKAVHVNAKGREFAAGISAGVHATCLHLQRNGYSLAYTLWEMEFDPARKVSESPMPDGYELRPVTADHHRAIWQCIGDAYDAGCPDGRFSHVPTEGRMRAHFRNDTADADLSLVAWQGSRVAGQVLCRVHERCGEVFEVSIGVGHRRRGLARELLTRGLIALQRQGVRTVRLGTTFENPTEAWRLYEQAGFRILAEFPRWRKKFTL